MTILDVTVFLGSGVSLGSGLPDVDELTALIRGQTSDQSKGRKECVKGNIPFDLLQVGDEPVNSWVSRFLRCLAEIDREYGTLSGRYHNSDGSHHQSGSIYRGSSENTDAFYSNYEDLFYLSQQVYFYTTGQSDNSFPGPFVGVLEDKTRNLLEEADEEGIGLNLTRLAYESYSFIERVVACTLQAEKVVGLDLIIEMARSPRIDGLNIITLNHDTLVEQALSAQDIEFADGFGEPDGDIRWHNDEVYDTAKTNTKIFKLHGSINWYSFRIEGRRAMGMPIRSSIEGCRNSEGQKLKRFIKNPSFLSGLNKATSYSRGIYADMHYRFHQVLRGSKKVVMSGYGWGDAAINHRLLRWLDRDKSNTLVLLHQNPKSEIRSNSSLLHQRYDSLISSGQLVSLLQWLSETSLHDLESTVFA